MNNHYLSFITVNYNGLHDTLELIESLVKFNSFPSEIVVVDNGSKINEADIIKTKYPFVNAIRSEQNLGFAGGNNLGIQEAKGDTLFFINNDTIIYMDGIDSLINTLYSKNNIGAISPKIKFYFTPQNIQFAGYTELTKYTLRNKLIGFGCKDDKKYDKLMNTPYLHGAAMLVKKSVVDEVGGIPECYFLYYEELDWSYKIREAGYSLLYDPSYSIFHKESQSTGQNSPFKTYYLTRNRLLYAFRNRDMLIGSISILYQMIFAIPKDIIKHILNKNIEISFAVIRGAKDFFLMKKI